MKEHLDVFHKKRSEECQVRHEANPKFCKECGKIISYKRALQKNTFCDSSCSASYNNKRRLRKKKIYTGTKNVVCVSCGEMFTKKVVNRGKKCLLCKAPPVANFTKGELFTKNKNWQSARSSIVKHARNLYLKHNSILSCVVTGCSYRNHIEVAHIKSVSSFDKDILIKEINSIENLVGLCPNHHWDFDHGFLVL